MRRAPSPEVLKIWLYREMKLDPCHQPTRNSRDGKYVVDQRGPQIAPLLSVRKGLARASMKKLMSIVGRGAEATKPDPLERQPIDTRATMKLPNIAGDTCSHE